MIKIELLCGHDLINADTNIRSLGKRLRKESFGKRNIASFWEKLSKFSEKGTPSWLSQNKSSLYCWYVHSFYRVFCKKKILPKINATLHEFYQNQFLIQFLKKSFEKNGEPCKAFPVKFFCTTPLKKSKRSFWWKSWCKGWGPEESQKNCQKKNCFF